MSLSGRRASRSTLTIGLLVALVILSTAAVQAAPTPPGLRSNTAPVGKAWQNHGMKAEEPAAPAPSAATAVVGITDPALITGATVYNFAGDAEFSTPTSFPGGTFNGLGEVRVIGSSWGTWNPNTPGIHVLFATAGMYEIVFDTPQQGVGAVAEPNNFATYGITIEAFGAGGNSLGSFTRMIDGNAGAAFLGLLSGAADIKRVVLSSEPGAAGFAFSDLTYSSAGDNMFGWVFMDVNGDGWRNPDETAGVPGAQVLLTINGQTWTLPAWEPHGYYQLPPFINLPGAYCLTLILPAGYTATTPANVCVEPGQDAPNFGVAVNNGVISGVVFRDANGNGVRDAGEAGIGGVTLELWLDGGASAVATTTTAADGAYTFNMVGAGAYSVRVTTTGGPLSGLGATTPNPATGIVVTAGGAVTDVNFGYGFTCSAGRSVISGRVWLDANANQAEDAGEAGIAGVNVCGEAFAWARSPRCASTDSQGNFQLCVVNAYTMVTATRPEGLTPTTPEFVFVNTPGAPAVRFGYR